jgi:uncharacterized protein YjbI with pentapeptide repeats
MIEQKLERNEETLNTKDEAWRDSLAAQRAIKARRRTLYYALTFVLLIVIYRSLKQVGYVDHLLANHLCLWFLASSGLLIVGVWLLFGNWLKVFRKKSLLAPFLTISGLTSLLLWGITLTPIGGVFLWLGALVLVGAAGVLITFLSNKQKKQIQFETTAANNDFADILNDFSNQTSALLRANAAMRLGDITKMVDPKIANPRKMEDYLFFESAASHLSLALITEEDEQVYREVARSIERMAEQSLYMAEASSFLANRVADANRRALSEFQTALSHYVNLQLKEGNSEKDIYNRLGERLSICADQGLNSQIIKQLHEEALSNIKDCENAPTLDDVGAKFAVLVATRDMLATCARIGDEEISRELELSDCFLASADLREAHLERARLERAHLQQSDLKEACLNEARMEGAYLQSAHMENADLSEADLSEAHLERAYLHKANLGGAELPVAHLEGADFQGADLSMTDLDGAHLEGARLEGADLSGADLDGARLDGAHLEGAHLSMADLKGARLDCARLDGANLYSVQYDEDTSFEGANWWAVDFTCLFAEEVNKEKTDTEKAEREKKDKEETEKIKAWLQERWPKPETEGAQPSNPPES